MPSIVFALALNLVHSMSSGGVIGAATTNSSGGVIGAARTNSSGGVIGAK